jgi:hypothetical protein
MNTAPPGSADPRGVDLVAIAAGAQTGGVIAPWRAGVSSVGHHRSTDPIIRTKTRKKPYQESPKAVREAGSVNVAPSWLCQTAGAKAARRRLRSTIHGPVPRLKASNTAFPLGPADLEGAIDACKIKMISPVHAHAGGAPGEGV